MDGKVTDFMPNIKKFDFSTASRIIELASLGYSNTNIAKMLGVSRNTLYRWIKRENLQSRMDKAQQEFMQSTIKRGLVALAEGAKSSEVTKEYVDTIKDEQGEVVKVTKVTEKIRTLAPNEKAIQILSQKYDKVFSQSEVKEMDGKQAVTVNINTSDMSLRELQQLESPLGPVGGVIEASSTVVRESLVDDEDLIPPDSELDGKASRTSDL